MGFSRQQARRPHLVRAGGGVSGELHDLRADLNQWSDELITAARIDIYVSAANGHDGNSGLSPRQALATFGAAVAKIPVVCDHSVVLHFASGTYTWDRTVGPHILRQPPCIIGDGAGQDGDDGFTELQAAKAAASGSGARVVVDPDGGFTVNQFQGKTILILNGAAAGDRRTIRNNTETDLVPSAAFSAEIAEGDTFRIVEPAVEFRMPVLSGIGGAATAITGCGVPSIMDQQLASGAESQKPSSIILMNLAISDTAGDIGNSFGIANSTVYAYGVEVRERGSTFGFITDQAAVLFSGMDFYATSLNFGARLPASLGLAVSGTSFFGWGLSSGVGSPVFSRTRSLEGFLTTPRMAGTAHFKRANWRLIGGALVGEAAINSNGFLIFDVFSRVYLQGHDALLPLLIECVGSGANSFAVMSAGGSFVGVHKTDVVITGSGVGLVAGSWHGSGSAEGLPGSLALARAASGMTISAPHVAVGATRGGRVHYDNFPTLSVVPSVAELAVWQGSISGVPTATSTFAGLADGASIVNATTPGDGTVIMRVT